MSDSEYAPSPRDWVRKQVEEYEQSGGTAGTTLRGMPVVVLHTIGVKSGKLRKVPLMRVEHDGVYAIVASLGGAPQNPVWYGNVMANPRVQLQDGPTVHELIAREVTGEEKAEWWKRAVAAYPDYADYQAKTDRQIPVFVLEPRSAESCEADGTEGGDRMGDISVADAVQAVADGALLLDVREDNEWAAGHAPDAVHIPMLTLSARTGEVPTDRTIVCVCHVGARSAVVADALNRAGWTAVNMAGGMEAWQAAGLPIVSP